MIPFLLFFPPAPKPDQAPWLLGFYLGMMVGVLLWFVHMFCFEMDFVYDPDELDIKWKVILSFG